MEPVNVNEVSRISAGTTFKGEITTPTDLRVDGTFEGKICSKGRVVVGEKAQIKGDIICQNVDFTGTRLQVELDAKFNGNCRMISEAEFDKIVAQMTGRPLPQGPAQPTPPQPQK